MNPFLNPHKRSYLLPRGRKNLLEPPGPARRETGSFIRDYAHLVLQLAREDGASEVVFGGQVPKNVPTPIRYKVGAEWYDTAPFPPGYRRRISNELMKQAGVAKTPYPRQGIVVTQLAGTVHVWRLRISDPCGECIITAVNMQ